MKKIWLKLRFAWFGTALCHWINRIHGSETIYFPSTSDARVQKVDETITILVTKRIPKRFLGICYGYEIIKEAELPITSLTRSNKRVPNVLSDQERLNFLTGKKVIVGESVVINGRQTSKFEIQ